MDRCTIRTVSLPERFEARVRGGGGGAVSGDDLPGRAKRTYTLTPVGRRLLADWAAALDRTNDTIAAFLRRYHEEQPHES